jgi:lactate permease
VKLARMFARTVWRVRWSLLTIAAMLALGYTTKYAGIDATMGLAFRQHGGAVPLLLAAARLAGRGADRERHVEQRAVRQPPAHHRGETRRLARPGGGGEQLRRA